MTTFSERLLRDTVAVLERLDRAQIEAVVDVLAETRTWGGRLSSVARAEARAFVPRRLRLQQLCDIESYAVTDNVSELRTRNQRRGLGGVVRGFGSLRPAFAERIACSCSRSEAATSGGTSAAIWSKPCGLRGSAERASLASSGATVERWRASLTRASSSRRSTPGS
jgi:hypothetical protein